MNKGNRIEKTKHDWECRQAKHSIEKTVEQVRLELYSRNECKSNEREQTQIAQQYDLANNTGRLDDDEQCVKYEHGHEFVAERIGDE